ncbi:MAG: hypothetical protein JXR50_06385 [Prolixibacteraceae bacterium]|nr:hypothetical protein [Prolixibacteraceae bacterium]MBN2649351.1 hypothetical protein [Prolixibacteraceae bacterium]
MSRDSEKERYKDKTNEIVNRPEIIPGIHNYCDRWCERCTFTSRCTVFLTEQEMGWNDNLDHENQEFWDKMSLVFESTMELLSESAKRLGIDLDSLDDEEIVEHEETEIEQFAREYSVDIHNWLKKENQFFNDFTVVDENSQKVVSITEALEVIEWYSMFISAKTHRAMYSFQFVKEDEYSLGDSQGSAKIAVIAIERSLTAFTVLYKQLPRFEDELLGFMVHLEKLKKGILAIVPGAMEFKRPGFDD